MKKIVFLKNADKNDNEQNTGNNESGTLKELTLLLAGNANAGKTTLFNTLTAAGEHVGNWHGVTVDVKSRQIKHGITKFNVADLPGAYSLTPFSREEEITRDFVLSHNSDVLVNVIDANNIEKSLYLTLQLLEAGVKMVLVLNMYSELAKRKRKLDINKLSGRLGIPVLKLSARDKKEMPKLLEACPEAGNNLEKLTYIKRFLNPQLLNMVQKRKVSAPFFYALKLTEQDEGIYKKLGLTIEEKKQVNSIAKENGGLEALAAARFNFIESILSECLTVEKGAKPYGFSVLDKIVLNRYLALPIFLLIMLGIFALTFGSVGAWLSDGFVFLFVNVLGSLLTDLVINLNAPIWVIALVRDCLVSGTGMVFSFLPQIVLLFLSLSLLEEAGYLSRLAFVLESIFSKLGLSGRSVFTLLMGFGCTATAVTTARNLENENIRKKTALLTPYMSCSAKLPVYVVLGGAFFGAGNVLLIFALYMLGVMAALLLSLILERTFLKSGGGSFVMEMPPYRVPSLKQVGKIALTNTELFTIRVGTVILSLSVLVWFLQNFTFGLVYITDPVLQISMLKQIGMLLAPVFEPLGWGSWGAVSAMLCGFVAKEVIISTVSILNGIDLQMGLEALRTTLSDPSSVVYFTPASAVSFLVFVLLFIPCIAALSSMRRELGTKVTALAIVLQFAVAYIFSFAAFKLANAVFVIGITNILWTLAAIVLIAVAGIMLYRMIKDKRCKTCASCTHRCF